MRKLKYINHREKLKLEYIVENKDSEDVILFLHGWGQAADSFLPIIQKLDTKKTIISFDLPGFGDSEEFQNISMDKKDFITKRYALVIKDFLNEQKYKNIIIVGHSFGCRIAFWLLNFDLPITKALLTGAAGIKPKRNWDYYISVGLYKFKKIILNTPFYIQFKKDVLAGSGSIDYKNASPIMKKVLIKTVNEDLIKLMSTIKQEVVLFWGSEDESTPLNDGLVMETKLSNSKLIKVSGTHYAFLEHQEKFTNILQTMI